MEGWRASEEDVAALLQACHPDPFAVLGPHAAPGGLVLRVLCPGAHAVEAHFGEQAYPLEMRDPGGFFEALIPGLASPSTYRLRIVEHGRRH
ncbi:MAG: 1,4-alpha-glucan branching enzyme, partial [Rubritepida sp.]|nr:1,4-alpha-glucan branching enzyme [Rubritepida sp.]